MSGRLFGTEQGKTIHASQAKDCHWVASGGVITEEMSQPQQKVVVLKQDSRVSIPPEVLNRDFWIEQRHALLMQLASIERLLGMVNRRCRYCNSRVEEKV